MKSKLFRIVFVVFVLLLVFAFPVFASTGRDAASSSTDLTPDLLAGAGGALLTLAFSYIPGLRTWYGALDDVKKSLIMSGGILVVALLIILSSCFSLWIVIQCVKPDILNFLKLIGVALVVNQGVYKLSPQTSDVTAAKAARL